VATAEALEMVAYWAATRPPTPTGYGGPAAMIAMDGRAYAMPGDVTMWVQDLRGRMPLNIPDRPALQRLLTRLGLQPLVADAWIDVLMDYTDADSLRRLNGAEREDYADLGLPPPRNDWLRTPAEVLGLPGWREAPAIAERVLQHASVRRSNWINPNTATPEVLQAYLPLSRPEQLGSLLDMRRRTPVYTAAQAREATGLDFSAEPFTTAVGPEFQVTLWAPGLPQALQYTITLMRASADGPWLVTEHSRAPRPPPSNAAEQLATFPLDLATGATRSSVAAPRP
jgi:general secretion pathway protein K